ncbi:hypothetical protein D3C87_1113020 [compost metagenome]
MVDETHTAFRRRAPDKPGNGIDDIAQAILRSADLGKGLGDQRLVTSTFVNINLQHTPAGDVPFKVFQWQASHMKPAVITVEAANALLDHVRFTGGDRMHPGSDDRWPVIRVHDFAGGPVFQDLEWGADVILDLAIDLFQLTGRFHERNHGRNAVDDRADVECVARIAGVRGAGGLDVRAESTACAGTVGMIVD